MLLYCLLFYWIFAGLFYFGYNMVVASMTNKNITVLFLSCIILGGIRFPIILGAELFKH